MSSLNKNESVSIFYIKKDDTWKKINVILYRSQRFLPKKWQNTAQLTNSGNKTSSRSRSFEAVVLNPCKIPVKEFIFSKVADRTSLSLQLHLK